jgi:hypothetical protein
MTPDDGTTEGFRIAYQKIESLLKRLGNRGVCSCCIARALALHAATLAEAAVGSDEAAEMFEYIVEELRENDVAAPDPSLSTQTH